MSKQIHIFRSFEEHELFFLKYFADLSPSERLQALVRIQRKSTTETPPKPQKKVTIRKHFITREKDLFDIARLEEIRKKADKE